MAEPTGAQTLETPQDAPGKGAYWSMEFAQAEKEEKEFREEARRILKIYRGSRSSDRQLFNLFWSNIETLKPTVLSRVPQADVSRRFQVDEGPYRQAALVLQKAVNAQNDLYAFGRELERVRDDRLLVGRGIGRVAYVRNFDQQTKETVSQVAPFRHVFWGDFLHAPARCWDEVQWVRYRHWMYKDRVAHQFGAETADKVVYDANPFPDDKAEKPGKDDLPGSVLKQAEVFEVWSRDANNPDTGKILWLARVRGRGSGTKESTTSLRVLKTAKPSVEFRGFFDCPEPLYATLTTDSLVPIADVSVYRELLSELNDVTARIRALTKMAQVKGVVDGSIKELPRVRDASDGQFIPTDQPAVMREKGGLAGGIWVWPLKDIVDAIQLLSVRQDQLKQMIYEVSGVSDVVRGATNAQETAAAQQLKSNYAQLRMGPRQLAMQRFVSRVFEMQAEVIAELFEPQVLFEMTGEQPDGQTLELMQDDTLRRFRIDVETDTLVAPDEAQSKQDAMEYGQAMSGFLEKSGMIAAQIPESAPLMMEMLKAVTRPFKFGRELEELVDELAEGMKQKARQPPPPPQPDPNEQLKAQTDLQEAQLKAQIEKYKADLSAQVDLQIAGLKAEVDQLKSVQQASMAQQRPQNQGASR